VDEAENFTSAVNWVIWPGELGNVKRAGGDQGFGSN